MAEQGEEQNKSEEASPFKLDMARRKGQVARGMDLGYLSALIGLAIAAQLSGRGLLESLALSARRSFAQFSLATGSIEQVTSFAGQEATEIATVLVVPGLIVVVLVAVIEILQIRGIVFTLAPLKPDFAKLNPGKGLKRLLSPQMLRQLLKNVFKFAVYCTGAYFLIRYLANDLAFAASDGGRLAGALAEGAVQLLLLFIILAACMALIDQLLSRREFSKQMRMSRREVTREQREREGEPRQKQKRKQILEGILEQAGAAAKVKGADVLIVNPTHYAVALRYQPEVADAPVVQARGRNAYAVRMRSEAQRLGIAIVRNPRLARALYREARLAQPIGPVHFVAVADIYIMLRREIQHKDGTE